MNIGRHMCGMNRDYRDMNHRTRKHVLIASMQRPQHIFNFVCACVHSRVDSIW